MCQTTRSGGRGCFEWCFFAMSELDANAIYSIRRHGDLVEIYGASPIAVRAAIEYFDHQLEWHDGKDPPAPARS